MSWQIGKAIVAIGEQRAERKSEEHEKQEREKLYFDLMQRWEWSEASKRLSPREILAKQRMAVRARERKSLEAQAAERGRRAELTSPENDDY